MKCDVVLMLVEFIRGVAIRWDLLDWKRRLERLVRPLLSRTLLVSLFALSWSVLIVVKILVLRGILSDI